jgi:hypothetical protein
MSVKSTTACDGPSVRRLILPADGHVGPTITRSDRDALDGFNNSVFFADVEAVGEYFNLVCRDVASAPVVQKPREAGSRAFISRLTAFLPSETVLALVCVDAFTLLGPHRDPSGRG